MNKYLDRNTHKLCSCCRTILPMENFSMTNSGKLTSKCASCILNARLSEQVKMKSFKIDRCADKIQIDNNCYSLFMSLVNKNCTTCPAE